MARKRETPEEYEMRVRREHAERHDARMNETMSRRDILEAIENAMLRYQDINAPSQILQLLLEAFE